MATRTLRGALAGAAAAGVWAAQQPLDLKGVVDRGLKAVAERVASPALQPGRAAAARAEPRAGGHGARAGGAGQRGQGLRV